MKVKHIALIWLHLKIILNGEGLSFHDLEKELTHQRALNFKYGHILGLSSMTYLASLNMNDLELLFIMR